MGTIILMLICNNEFVTLWLILFDLVLFFVGMYLYSNRDKKVDVHTSTLDSNSEKREKERLDTLKILEEEDKQQKIDTEYNNILEKCENYIDKFCEISEREVSVRDEWGDENLKALPKLKKECILRVGKNLYPEMSEDDMLQWFNDYDYYKYIHTKFKSWAGDKPNLTVSFPDSDNRFDNVPVPYWVNKLFNETLDERFRNYHKKRKEHYIESTVDLSNMSGVEFEEYLSTILDNKGFGVSGTPVTGDQGADIIATKQSKIYVIQAKRHTQPVGNGAIQEVVAARNYYKGDIGVVVTSSSFTPSAKLLARRNNIILINGKEIPQISNILKD